MLEVLQRVRGRIEKNKSVGFWINFLDVPGPIGKEESRGRGLSSVVECLPTMCKTLVSIPQNKNKQTKKAKNRKEE